MGKQRYRWAVIGAGPAGMAAVGKLLDYGIAGDDIAWIDPHFDVGDFGRLWPRVPSNTKVQFFTQFLEASPAFEFRRTTSDAALAKLPLEDHCLLHVAADAMRVVSRTLQSKVVTLRDKALWVGAGKRTWATSLESGQVIAADKLVLALGAEPRQLPIAQPEVIPLVDALDVQRLQPHLRPDDCVAVFGSSHSAMIAVRLLLELGVKKVVNFYRSPLCYALFMDGWILHDNTGLKGETARWCREDMPEYSGDRLLRTYSEESELARHLPLCQKAIHAVGFAPRLIPIEGLPHLAYDTRTGIIAPGLFGVGIGFPEETTDPFGRNEVSVGAWKFMKYLSRVIPAWVHY